ncbi:C2 domain protein [Necator americanus]|uniref:C2 domain protein n=1 Tax=Necator americanus TaxID=51031 RepID=W2TTI2_NECAM|nr:C2 domain protein [Necator americanus]ETN85375.1 C2 domain protein [Necator americanus]
MLIPVCCDRLPIRLEVAVISANGLPIMNKSINSTDAFVEIRFADDVQKTEVVTSLNPRWDSELFPFDTDEKQLVECNRGELKFRIKLQLLVETDLRNYVQILSGYQIYSGYKIVEIVGLMHELKSEKDPDYEWLDRIRTPKATNEARQSAIRDALRSAVVSLAHKVNKHQCNLICGYQEYLDVEGSSTDLFTVRVLGTALRIQKVKYAEPCSDRIPFSILTLNEIPGNRQCGIGAIVATRAVHVLEDNDEDPEDTRKRFKIAVGGMNFDRNYISKLYLLVAMWLLVIQNNLQLMMVGVALIGCIGTAVVMGHEEEATLVSRNLHADSDRSDKLKRKFLSFAPMSMSISNRHLEDFQETREKQAELNERFRYGLFDFNYYLSSTALPAWSEIVYTGSYFFLMTVTDSARCVHSSVITMNSKYKFPQPKKFQRIPMTQMDMLRKSAIYFDLLQVLPFADHDLFNTLLGEAKSLNPNANAVFDVICTYSLSDSILVSVVTGVLVRLVCLPRDESVSPSLSNVLSFTSLQRYNDARRFSWGTVREAIRFKQSITPGISLKILNLKPPNSELSEMSASKNRLGLNTFVGKIRRRQHEKEYVSHMVFERHLSISIGLLDPTLACNSNSIAGMHISPSLSNCLLAKDRCGRMKVLTRWSDVFIREDLTNTIKDSQSVDTFVTNALEERLCMARSVAAIGGDGSLSGGSVGSACNIASALSGLRIASPQFSVSKEHAHMIMLMSCDVNCYE